MHLHHELLELVVRQLPVGVVLGASVLAGLVGWSALRTLLLVLRKGSFPYFAGYCALLGVTMGLGIILNLVYLAGYWAFPRAMLEVKPQCVA